MRCGEVWDSANDWLEIAESLTHTPGGAVNRLMPAVASNQ